MAEEVTEVTAVDMVALEVERRLRALESAAHHDRRFHESVSLRISSLEAKIVRLEATLYG